MFSTTERNDLLIIRSEFHSTSECFSRADLYVKVKAISYR